MRVAASVAAVAAIAGAGVTAGLAQEPAPTVSITAGPGRLEVAASGPLPAGPTRFAVQGTGEDAEVLIAQLRPGVDRDTAVATLRRNPDAALDLVHVVGSVALVGGRHEGAATVTLEPDAGYLLVNVSGENPAAWGVADLATTGTSNGASPPSADARVRMVDLRFRGDTRLPRDGVVRFENRGWAPHFAFAARLRPGSNARQVASALLRDDERELGRRLQGRTSLEPTGLITRGAVSYSEVRFPRAGRYVMVCFFEGHNTQGMFRFVRVR